MKKATLLSIASAAFLLVPAFLSAGDGIDRLVSRYADVAAADRDVSGVARLRESILSDGSWADIDYADQRRSKWTTGTQHLRQRLCALAADWRRNRNSASLAVAHLALQFWLSRRFTNPNWWWNVIGVPMSIGETALMMGAELTDEERRGVIEIMSVKEPGNMNGQNLAWVAENRLRRGLIARDETMVRDAIGVIVGTVSIGDSAGIQEDWCFFQHGPQPQFGNYGLGFLSAQSRLAAILAGTDFPSPAEKLELIRNLASEGYSWIIWNGMMDVSALGRQLFRNAQRERVNVVRGAFANLEKTGWRRPPARIGFRYFHKSAYAVYRTADFMASIRASTPAIIGTETWINEDNAKGMCMADGALMTYVTGHEYENVFPLWDDWRMIPGVTAYLGKPVNRKNSRNERDDIRAAATGDGGAFEFTFAREGLVAHKKWTFSPNGIVGDGSGISATDGAYEVATCVEHSIAAGNAGVVYRREGESRFRNGALVYTVHAPEDAIRFEVAAREGSFSTFMLAEPFELEKGKVFSLRILHGRNPQGAAYRYEIALDEDFTTKKERQIKQ